MTWAKVLTSELGSQLPYALPGESKKSESGESEEKMADEIVREALIGAPRALRATKKKMLALKKRTMLFLTILTEQRLTVRECRCVKNEII